MNKRLGMGAAFTIKLVVYVLSLLSCAPVISQTDEAAVHWLASWSASIMPQSVRDTFASEDFADTTIRQIVHTSIGGRQLRLRISNVFGDGPLEIAELSVALQEQGATIDQASLRRVSFSGQTSLSLPQGEFIYSDPLALEISAFSNVAVSMYFAAPPGAVSAHGSAWQSSYISRPGNYAEELAFPVFTDTQGLYFLSGLEVAAEQDSKLIVAFGDSITSGTGSSLNGNQRWPDLLARRLAGSAGVINQGLAGNRLLHDFAGPSGLDRFERDVLSWSGLSHIIVLIGINDIGYSRYPAEVFPAGIHSAAVSVAELLAGYRILINKARDAGVRIIAATLPPFKGAGYFTAAGEAKRQAINAWIRDGGEFDGVIDFDRALRAADDPEQMRADYQQDWLHPNDAGYKAMAESVELGLLE